MNDLSKDKGMDMPAKSSTEMPAANYRPGLFSIVRTILRWCWPRKERGRCIDIEFERETVRSDGSGTRTKAKISLRDNSSKGGPEDANCH